MVAGIIGNPVEEPAYHRSCLAGFESLGFQCINEVPERSDFRDCVERMREQQAKGCVILPPFRADAARIAERFFSVERSSGIANVLVFGNPGCFGANTEAEAFLQLLEGVDAADALVLGHGPKARMAGLALASTGWNVKVWNQTILKSRVLAATLASFGNVELMPSANPQNCRLVVNATHLGTKAGEEPPVLWDKASPGTIALDLVHRNVATEFLRSASRRGFRTVDGRRFSARAAQLAVRAIAGTSPNLEVLEDCLGIKASDV